MACEQCSAKSYPRYSWESLNVRQCDLMVVGESPTAQEVVKKQVMTGSGAQVLQETLHKVGMPHTPDKVYYTTALKCAVPKGKNRKIPKDAPTCCRQFLLKEIEQVKPKMVLICGATAMHTFLGTTAIKITEEYGRVREYDNFPGIKFMPIMNPGVLLHKPGDYKPFLAMMQLAATIYNGGEAVDTGETKWTVLRTREDCVTLWRHMMDLNKCGKLDYISCDIETTGLDYRVVDFCVLGICFERNHAYVLPRELKEAAHNFLEGVPWKIIWQGGKYDKKVMWRRGLANLNIDEDTMYMHYVLDETSAHDLGYLSKVYLNAAEYKYKMNQNWKAVSLETYEQFFEALCERVAVDTDYTLQLFHKFNEILDMPENQKLKEVYHGLLIPAANFLSRVEQNGILIDAEYLQKLDVEYTQLLERLSAEIDRIAAPFWDAQAYQLVSGAKSLPTRFNPASPQQMAWMVFDRLKLNPRIRKGRSTDKDILKSIDKPHPLVTKVLEYRTVQKEHSTYVLGLLNARDTDGRVRSTFSLHITATGRLSSKEPNVQNQPSANGVGNIRKAFVARPGYVLAEIDYSGAELRWLAVLSKCPVLGEIFKTDRNLHNETAKSLFGEHFTKAQKLRAKAINFGIAYGRKPQSIAEEYNISLEEATQMMNDWLSLYHGAAKYLLWCDEQVVQGNYMESPFGRRRRFGLVSPGSLGALQNESRNFPIQSASSDLLLVVAMEVEEKLLKEFDTKIINLVHDSMVLEIPADAKTIAAAGQYCYDMMVSAPKRLFDIDVPFRCDYEIGLNWGDLVEFNLTAAHTGTQVRLHEDDEEMIPFEEWYGKQLEVK